MTQARFELSGIKYRLQDFGNAQVKLGDALRLVPEPDNAYDPNAIAVYKDTIKIGFVPRRENKAILPYVAAGKATCVVEAVTSAGCWVLVEMP